jgi:hypothetical protein
LPWYSLVPAAFVGSTCIPHTGSFAMITLPSFAGVFPRARPAAERPSLCDRAPTKLRVSCSHFTIGDG